MNRRQFLTSTISGLAALGTSATAAQSQWVRRLTCNFSYDVIDGRIIPSWSDKLILDGGAYIASRIGLDHSSGIPRVVKQMCDALGIHYDQFEVYLYTKNNAWAALHQRGRMAIAAGPRFLLELNRDSRTSWTAVFVLAHELGHHIAGFGGRTQSDAHFDELNADYWAGFICQKLGAGQDAIVAASSISSSEFDTHTHPRRSLRVEAARRGWINAVDNVADATRCRRSTTTVPTPRAIQICRGLRFS